MSKEICRIIGCNWGNSMDCACSLETCWAARKAVNLPRIRHPRVFLRLGGPKRKRIQQDNNETGTDFRPCIFILRNFL